MRWWLFRIHGGSSCWPPPLLCAWRWAGPRALETPDRSVVQTQLSGVVTEAQRGRETSPGTQWEEGCQGLSLCSPDPSPAVSSLMPQLCPRGKQAAESSGAVR